MDTKSSTRKIGHQPGSSDIRITSRRPNGPLDPGERSILSREQRGHDRATTALHPDPRARQETRKLTWRSAESCNASGTPDTRSSPSHSARVATTRCLRFASGPLPTCSGFCRPDPRGFSTEAPPPPPPPELASARTDPTSFRARSCQRFNLETLRRRLDCSNIGSKHAHVRG